MPAPFSVLALIPARSGSRGVPGKNVRPIAGKPLIAWSIEHARAVPGVTRTIVSTDAEEYAAIARRHGAEAPFLRPAAIAGDHATDLECLRHALAWLREHEGWEPEIVLHLRPTHPIREVADTEAILALLRADPELDSVRSVVPAPCSPFKMWLRDPRGRLAPVADAGLPEGHSLPRQVLPSAWLQNACTDAVRARVVRAGSMTGRHVHGYPMEASYDIDSEADFARVEAALRALG